MLNDPVNFVDPTGEYPLENPLSNFKSKMNKSFADGHYTLLSNNGKTISMVQVSGKYTTGNIGELTVPNVTMQGNIWKGNLEAQVAAGWNTYSASLNPFSYEFLGYKMTCGVKGNAGGLGFNAAVKFGKKGFKFNLGGTVIVGGGIYIIVK